MTLFKAFCSLIVATWLGITVLPGVALCEAVAFSPVRLSQDKLLVSQDGTMICKAKGGLQYVSLICQGDDEPEPRPPSPKPKPGPKPNPDPEPGPKPNPDPEPGPKPNPEPVPVPKPNNSGGQRIVGKPMRTPNPDAKSDTRIISRELISSHDLESRVNLSSQAFAVKSGTIQPGANPEWSHTLQSFKNWETAQTTLITKGMSNSINSDTGPLLTAETVGQIQSRLNDLETASQKWMEQLRAANRTDGTAFVQEFLLDPIKVERRRMDRYLVDRTFSDEKLDAERTQDNSESGRVNSVSRLAYQDDPKLYIFKPDFPTDPTPMAAPKYAGVDPTNPRYAARNIASREVDRALLTNVVCESRFIDHLDKFGLAMDQAAGQSLIEGEKVVELPFAKDDPRAPRLARQLSNLEWVDALCGQLDRTPQNYLVDNTPDEKGQPDVSVTGIDNDFSFGKFQTGTEYNIPLQGGQTMLSKPGEPNLGRNDIGLPPLIDSDTYRVLTQLNYHDMIHMKIKPYLTQAELDATEARFEQLKTHAQKLNQDGLVVDDWDAWVSPDPEKKGVVDYLTRTSDPNNPDSPLVQPNYFARDAKTLARRLKAKEETVPFPPPLVPND